MTIQETFLTIFFYRCLILICSTRSKYNRYNCSFMRNPSIPGDASSVSLEMTKTNKNKPIMEMTRDRQWSVSISRRSLFRNMLFIRTNSFALTRIRVYDRDGNKIVLINLCDVVSRSVQCSKAWRNLLRVFYSRRFDGTMPLNEIKLSISSRVDRSSVDQLKSCTIQLSES